MKRKNLTKKMAISLLGGFFILGASHFIMPDNLAGACSCGELSPEQSIQENMYSLQYMVEQYAENNQGVYPRDLETLYQEAIKPERDFWNDLHNPFSSESGIGKAILMYSTFKKLKQIDPKMAGIVLYEPVGEPALSYRIYSLDGQAKLRMTEEGQPYFMTHEETSPADGQTPSSQNSQS